MPVSSLWFHFVWLLERLLPGFVRGSSASQSGGVPSAEPPSGSAAPPPKHYDVVRLGDSSVWLLDRNFVWSDLPKPVGWYAVTRNPTFPRRNLLAVHGCVFAELELLAGGQWWGSGAFCKRFDKLQDAIDYFVDKLHEEPYLYLHRQCQQPQIGN
jgi:hypothetical protein